MHTDRISMQQNFSEKYKLARNGFCLQHASKYICVLRKSVQDKRDEPKRKRIVIENAISRLLCICLTDAYFTICTLELTLGILNYWNMQIFTGIWHCYSFQVGWAEAACTRIESSLIQLILLEKITNIFLYSKNRERRVKRKTLNSKHCQFDYCYAETYSTIQKRGIRSN